MKSVNLNLQNSVSLTYDKTKTTVAGRVVQKTINSQQVLGPTLTQFIDCQTQTANTPSYSKYNPNTGRLFVLSTISASPTILLFNVSLSGVQQYVGKIIVTLANSAVTTHTSSGIDVDDNGATWQIYLGTRGSVVINGGVFLVNGISLADFTPAGNTIWAAQTTGQKAVYFLQDDLFKGVSNNLTTLWGLSKFTTSPSSSFNTKLYAMNNTALAPQVVAFETATTPAVANTTTSISAQTTLYAGTSPSAFYTSGATNPGLVGNDPIIVTGVGPANVTISPISATQTVYFVRDIQFVGGAYYFNLSLTAAGAAVVPTSAVSGTANVMRAFGTCTNLFYGRTPVVGMTPALTGTLLQSNIVDHAMPTSVPLNAALNGQDCIALATSTQLYLGKVSDLFMAMSGTSTGSTITVSSTVGLAVGMAVTGPGINPGSTILSFTSTVITLSLAVLVAQGASTSFVFGAASWTSLTGSNILGTGVDIVNPTVAFMKYSDLLDRFVFVTNSSICIVKQLKNNEITGKFGNVDNTWLEAPSTLPTVPSGMITIVGLEVQGGIVFLNGGGIGQRGITFTDIYSDHGFGNSYLISPVSQINPASVIKYISSLEQLFDYTNTLNFFIRTGTSSSDSVFSTAAGGWSAITKSTDLNLSVSNPYYQIKVDFNILGALNATPAQINDVVLSIIDPNELSDYWEGSVDNTSGSGASPAYTAFRLNKAYASSVPTMYFRAYDDSGNLVISANTVSNPTLFEYSTNNGTSWNALGTIPNTILTTEIRYKWASPPGVVVSCSIRES